MIKMARPGTVIPVLWTLLTTLLAQVTSTGMFEVHLESFRNDLGVDAYSNCCEGIRRDGRCVSSCRTFFRVCLKEYQAHITNNTPCTFGSVTTPVLGHNSFSFPDSVDSFSNPLQLPFDFAWPGDFTLIITALHDKTTSGPAPGSPRDVISQLAFQGSVAVGREWEQNVYSTNTSELRYSYRVVCDHSYYGDKCLQSCNPRDDQFGHYTCGAEGEKICLDGWTGDYCDTAICLPGCHSVNGFCEKPNECQCHTGWQGQLCDQCIKYPGCQHGTCQEPWKCDCVEGWGGIFCTEDLNYCTNHSPCKNGATCTNTGQGLYTCTCRTGYTGSNCEIEIDDCLHQPCLNGGECMDTGKDYTCRCPHGYHGRHCESSATSCEESPCRNGAVCTPQLGGYRCTCSPGYTGVNCEVEVNECASGPAPPCLNGGSCVDDLNGFHCVCRAGYSGELCQVNRNDCTMSPCQNGATCLDRINEFECRCPPGFSGNLCEVNIDDCDTNPCANGGLCQDLVNDFRCVCPLGFSGKDCRDNEDDCAEGPCKNGATCTDLINGYSCECPPDFFGKNCEHVIGHSIGLSTPMFVTPTESPNTEDKTGVITKSQLLMILCLGFGIPLIVTISVIIFIVCNRRRNNAEHMDNKQNERNEVSTMNNRNKKSDPTSNIIQNLSPPGTQTLKVTNEEMLPHRKSKAVGSAGCSGITHSTNHNQLNVDSCTINKNYLKDNINKQTSNKELLEVHRDYKRPPAGQLMDYSNHQDRGRPIHDPKIPDLSDYSRSGDLHKVKPLNTEPHPGGSIFFLGAPHGGHEYSEGMLATEV